MDAIRALIGQVFVVPLRNHGCDTSADWPIICCSFEESWMRYER